MDGKEDTIIMDHHPYTSTRNQSSNHLTSKIYIVSCEIIPDWTYIVFCNIVFKLCCKLLIFMVQDESLFALVFLVQFPID